MYHENPSNLTLVYKFCWDISPSYQVFSILHFALGRVCAHTGTCIALALYHLCFAPMWDITSLKVACVPWVRLPTAFWGKGLIMECADGFWISLVYTHFASLRINVDPGECSVTSCPRPFADRLVLCNKNSFSLEFYQFSVLLISTLVVFIGLCLWIIFLTGVFGCCVENTSYCFQNTNCNKLNFLVICECYFQLVFLDVAFKTPVVVFKTPIATS